MKNIQKIIFFFLIPMFGYSQIIEETTEGLDVDYSKSTINTRFFPPKGYSWKEEKSGSFGEFLATFPLYPEHFPVRTYKKIPLAKQYNHVAILKVDVGEKDLQQCADAWMRLYSEYLWAKKDYDKIVFQFTSGQYLSWNDYKNGTRTIEIGDKVKFIKKAKFDDSYKNFRKYLNLVFNYAGTISLDRESKPILRNKDIQTGDFLINPGSPGHSVFIVGIAENAEGKRVYLLAESFMPAQDIHIIINPLNKNISPWYELNVNAPVTQTAKYTFKPTSVKRFHTLWEPQ
ncbi:MAG: DUF4846 domain-containing protein [Flavobacteriaceae bacterium]|jgi:hypothetical protein|nr:DUF4846 domain-containing protein [Flavobacteriaceae bacterium]